MIDWFMKERENGFVTALEILARRLFLSGVALLYLSMG